MSKPTSHRFRLQLWELDDRIVPNTTPATTGGGAFGNLNNAAVNDLLNNPTAQSQLLELQQNLQQPGGGQGPGGGGGPVLTASPATPPPPAPPPPPAFASFLPDRAARPQVRLLNASGTTSGTVTVFAEDFTGGIWTARADVTGDGKADTIAASGPGIPSTVAVFDALDNRLVRTISPYEPSYTGGVLVAAADLTGDGRAEIVTGTNNGGGPRVRVYSGLDNSLLADFLAIEDPEFRGGVRIALGDVNGDGVADLIATAGFGGGPRIAIFDGLSVAAGNPTRLVADFFAFEPTLRDGVHPAVGKIDADNKVDLFFGAGPGGAPRVLGINSATLFNQGADEAIAGAPVNFFAGLGERRGGVRIGTLPNANGLADIITADGDGGLVGRYTTSGKLLGTIDRELALSSGLLSDSTGQALTLGTTTGTGGTGTGTGTGGAGTGTGTGGTGTNLNTAQLQQLLNSLGLGDLSQIGLGGTGTGKGG